MKIVLSLSWYLKSFYNNHCVRCVRYFFLALYENIPIEHRDMISITAPKMVIILPENSLPNNNPSPIPPNMPIAKPDLVIFLIQ